MPDYNLPSPELLEEADSSVSLKFIIASDAWKSSDARIPIILGEDESDHAVIADLADVPHMLISGLAGSEKSACINLIIMSLLFRFPPSMVEFFLIDSIAKDFVVYESLPHLVTPVVHNKRKVPAVFHWCVNEMNRRSSLCKETGVSNIYEFNSRNKGITASIAHNGDPIPDKLPSIVIVIAELADIFTDNSKDYLEDKIVKIAAKGADAGIHLLIATQAPSKKMLSSGIQKNILSRITFRLLSSTDCRRIIGKSCAEKLNIAWDMFSLKPGNSELRQVKRAFISAKEIGKIVNFITRQSSLSCKFNDFPGL